MTKFLFSAMAVSFIASSTYAAPLPIETLDMDQSLKRYVSMTGPVMESCSDPKDRSGLFKLQCDFDIPPGVTMAQAMEQMKNEETLGVHMEVSPPHGKTTLVTRKFFFQNGASANVTLSAASPMATQFIQHYSAANLYAFLANMRGNDLGSLNVMPMDPAPEKAVGVLSPRGVFAMDDLPYSVRILRTRGPVPCALEIPRVGPTFIQPQLEIHVPLDTSLADVLKAIEEWKAMVWGSMGSDKGKKNFKLKVSVGSAGACLLMTGSEFSRHGLLEEGTGFVQTLYEMIGSLPADDFEVEESYVSPPGFDAKAYAEMYPDLRRTFRRTRGTLPRVSAQELESEFHAWLTKQAVFSAMNWDKGGVGEFSGRPWLSKLLPNINMMNILAASPELKARYMKKQGLNEDELNLTENRVAFVHWLQVVVWHSFTGKERGYPWLLGLPKGYDWQAHLAADPSLEVRRKQAMIRKANQSGSPLKASYFTSPLWRMQLAAWLQAVTRKAIYEGDEAIQHWVRGLPADFDPQEFASLNPAVRSIFDREVPLLEGESTSVRERKYLHWVQDYWVRAKKRNIYLPYRKVS